MEIKILIWGKIASPGLVFSFKRMSKTQNRMLEEEERGSHAGESPEPVDVVPAKLEI